MNAAIHKPNSVILSKYIDYFLFLSNDSGNGFYKTFPNTNVCLAFFEKNDVHWDRYKNACEIRESLTVGNNRLFGFHRRPFSVSYKGPVKQVCIIFKLEAVTFFTDTPVCEIDPETDPAFQLFGKEIRSITDFMFSLSDREKQVEVLESFLLKQLKAPAGNHNRFFLALDQLKRKCPEENSVVGFLSSELNVNPSTLYRRFMCLFGQSPKDIYKTFRFRRTLCDLLSQKQTLTQTAYDHNFFDQSHFIKDIRQFTGESPKKLLNNILDVQDTLLWMKS